MPPCLYLDAHDICWVYNEPTGLWLRPGQHVAHQRPV